MTERETKIVYGLGFSGRMKKDGSENETVCLWQEVSGGRVSGALRPDERFEVIIKPAVVSEEKDV